MEPKTILNNGGCLKSQKSRGNFLRVNKLIALLALVVLFSGCSTRLVDFTIISSKNHSLRFDMNQSRHVEGTSIGFWGIGSSIKGAMDKAIESAGVGYDLLVDGVVIYQDYFFVNGYKVTGTAVKSSEIIAKLGEDGFQNWLTENNVFDPMTATIKKQ